MAVIKYRSSDGSIKSVPLIGGSGVASINGKRGIITGVYSIDNPPPYPVTSVNGKTGAIIDVYSKDSPPPYPVTSVDGKTGNINSTRIIYGSTYPLTIGQSSGIVVLVANISGSTLPIGNTATYEILFDEAYPVPIAASFIGGGYSLQISVVRSASNKSFYVNITNHGFEDAISLNGSLVVAFIPNGATSVTGVSNA